MIASTSQTSGDIVLQQNQPPAAGHPLWAALQSYDFNLLDPELTFEKRLARENGWSLAFAEQVVAEYRRFLFLSQAAGHPVTPSDEVDQAWHLHLVYTRAYWEDLCGRVLSAPLHHGPTRGGAVEGAKFEAWYERTKASYRSWFGEQPPADIWPDSATRFGRAASYRRISKADYWLLPKKRLARLGAASAIFPIGLLASGFLGDLPLEAKVLFFVAVFFVVVLPIVRWIVGRRRNRRNGRGRGGWLSGSGCGSSGCGTDSGCGGGGCGGGCGS